MKVGSLVMFSGRVGIVLSMNAVTSQVYFVNDGEACVGSLWLEVVCE